MPSSMAAPAPSGWSWSWNLASSGWWWRTTVAASRRVRAGPVRMAWRICGSG